MVATIRPGNNTGDSWVVGIQCVGYPPNGFIIYKLEHGDYEWQNVPGKWFEKKEQHAEPTRLYERKRKDSGKKFSHLQQLKAVMPKE